MLIYHFGCREGLLAAVTQAVEEQQRAALLEPGATTADHARQAWRRLSDPKLWPQERLFFELYAYALRGRPGTEGFLDGIVESWVAPTAAALIKAGAEERTARADARLAVAVVRGLLLDLLATGDRAGVTEAYERFLQHASTTAATPASGWREPGSRSSRSRGKDRRGGRKARREPAASRHRRAPRVRRLPPRQAFVPRRRQARSWAPLPMRTCRCRCSRRGQR